jgi:hypothetical protein
MGSTSTLYNYFAVDKTACYYTMNALRYQKMISLKEKNMKAISIRGLEPQVAEKLKTAAQKES